MRTTEEIIAFMKEHKIGSREAPKHVPLGVEALLPDEEVLFAFCGNQNSHGLESQGIHAYLLTAQRLIVAQGNIAFQKGNLRGVEVYPWNSVGGISYKKGFLTNTIIIHLPYGAGTIMVDKPGTLLIFNSLNEIRANALNA
ncbi:MAG: PH domain-containing protein [Clostridia bacterium]|nr:PH domain-containing protein [Clostridia bacterium]